MWQLSRAEQYRRFGPAAALPALSLALFQCCNSGPSGWARWAKKRRSKVAKNKEFYKLLADLIHHSDRL